MAGSLDALACTPDCNARRVLVQFRFGSFPNQRGIRTMRVKDRRLGVIAVLNGIRAVGPGELIRRDIGTRFGRKLGHGASVDTRR